MSDGADPLVNSGVALSRAREVLLAMVSDPGRFVAAPSMRLAVASLLPILDAMQSVKEHREAWTHLATEIARVVIAAGSKVDDRSSPGQDTLKQIEELQGILSKANETLTRMKSRSCFNFIRDRSALQEIHEYRDRVGRVREFFEQKLSPSAAPLQPVHNPPLPPNRNAPTINVIHGNSVVNNINQVTTNTRSYRVTTVNTIDSYNVYNVAGRNAPSGMS